MRLTHSTAFIALTGSVMAQQSSVAATSTQGLSSSTAPASNQTLYVSSYSGNVTQLLLNDTALTSVADFQGCEPNPTWLTVDKPNNALFCLGEYTPDLKGNGSITSYGICQKTGNLTRQDHRETINGPVNSVIYQSTDGKQAIALAHYGGSAVSTFTIGDDPNKKLSLTANSSFTFEFPNHPGPNKDRQGASYAHEAILDPSGRYLLVPDLGMDLVHIFGRDPKTNNLTLKPYPLQAAPGSGPRHGTFWFNKAGTLFFYLVSELSAKLTGYQVEYRDNQDPGMFFTELFETDTVNGASIPGVAPAEIAVTPDKTHLLVSNRNDSSVQLPNPDPRNSTPIYSDTIASWRLGASGKVTFEQLVGVGGRFPRHFEVNAAGDKIAVVLQNDNRVAILDRDVKNDTGLHAPKVYVTVPDNPTCVVWSGM